MAIRPFKKLGIPWLASRPTRLAAIGVVVLGLGGSTPAQQAESVRAGHDREGNAVTHWNAVAEAAFSPTQGTNPMAQSRTFAIFHAAIHDALNAIDQRFELYTPGLASSPGASIDTAVAAAAHDVLLVLLPSQASLVESAYTKALAAIPDGAAKRAGVATGQRAAQATLVRRQADGAENATQPVYMPRPGAGEYQFTPPFNIAVQPGWGSVRPFIIDLRAHVVEGPLPLSSPKYARDLAHVKAIGDIHSRIRTPDQSVIAEFWYEDSPLGWNRIANTAVRQRQLDPWEAARTFALVHFAMADGFIAGFEAKYRYRFWRPVTAIHNADTDGNADTAADANWQPFLITPPVPDYPSTHTVLGWAAAEVLIELLGDTQRFTATSLTLPGVSRSFQRFSAAAEENGLSRLYAGIHFREAVSAGRRQGRSIGRAVAEALGPVRSHPHRSADR
jgi:hypothetical protein